VLLLQFPHQHQLTKNDHIHHQQEAVAHQTSLNENRAKIVSLNSAVERTEATMKNMVEEHEEHLCLLEAQVEEAQMK